MAPSIYEYRSETEWAQAMQEWCAENEPYWLLRFYDWEAMQPKTQRFDDEAAAQAALAREREIWWRRDTFAHCPSLDFTADGPFGHLRSKYDDPTNLPGRASIPSHSHFSPENRDGGTRAEYRALGLR